MLRRAAAVLLGAVAVCAQAQITDPVPGAPRTTALILPGQSLESTSAQLTLARATNSYPVTPGDVYQITYQLAGGTVNAQAVVDGRYAVNLGIFGALDATGLTFADLAARVNKMISSSYKNSAPDIEIVTVGGFQVLLNGHVPKPMYVPAWGLSRLSDILDGKLGAYSSERRVVVTKAGGAARTYDFFLSRRVGDETQNPFMHPGDSVTVDAADEIVSLDGGVNRPGRYEVLPTDDLARLIEEYGDGLTSDSDPRRIRLDRIGDEGPKRLYLDFTEPSVRTMALRHGDAVAIESRRAALPVAFFEGALQSQTVPAGETQGPPTISQPGVALQMAAGPQGSGTPEQYARIVYSFLPGERLSDALSGVSRLILPNADLERAYLYPADGSALLPIDLRVLVYEPHEAAVNPVLRPYDRLVVPFARETVAVAGAVIAPGVFPYSPHERFQYYISLAGGIDPERSSGQSVAIQDALGNARSPGDLIQPGDRIFFPSDGFAYNLRLYIPAITTTVSLVTAVVTLIAVLTP